VIPGNSYPVIETHTTSDNPITPGYNSHYVLTEKNGCCCNKPIVSFFDEIVIEQEAQITPIYIIELKPKKTAKIAKTWERQVNSNVHESESIEV